MSDSNKVPERSDDPRPVSDHQLREQYTREQIEQWRHGARVQHRRWMEVMKNRYGKD